MFKIFSFETPALLKKIERETHHARYVNNTQNKDEP